MPNWTIPQQNAINARNSNILVSAAAGSGKTAVLVERVLKLVIDEMVPVDKLLIVTFTNAAAAEMRSRIASGLKEIIKKDNNNTNAKMQLALLPSAKICTIDSFCIGLVRENFFNLDIEQDFRIMDESEVKIIEQDVVDEIIEELYDEENSKFYSLVEMFSTPKSDSNLSQTIISINNFISSQATPYIWLNEACECYNPSQKLENTVYADYVFKETIEYINYSLELIQESKSLLQIDDLCYEKYNEVLDDDSSIFNKLKIMVENKEWDNIPGYINSISYIQLRSPKKGYESPVKEQIKDNRDIYKSIISKSISPLYASSSTEFKEDCEYIYPNIKLLVEIIKEFQNRVLAYKKEINAYTFSDIEHFAIELLYSVEDGKYAKTDLALNLEDNFKEILVDEYQDTNSAQDKLFEMLSNGKNRFMVGDIKQSIYRFRLAMPYIFNNMKNTFDDYDKVPNSISKKINLSNNFRSRKGICEFTNFIFSRFMSANVGDVDYNSNEYLYAGAEYEDSDVPCAQLKLVETPENEDADEYEAHQIAKTILKKIESKEKVRTKDGKYVPVSFKDFAVLIRSANLRMPVYEKVFSQYGIPTICNNKINLFDNKEIIILVNLLRSIDNPVQDIPLLSTLMSVFYGYSADDIAKARLEFKANNLYSSIAKSDVFSKIVSDLDRYRHYEASMSVENLLRTIVEETSYISIISAMGNHQQRMLNIMKLIDISKNFDSGDNVGLTSFIRYIDTIVKNKYNVDSASVTHTDDNSVKLMSVHKSKGLEFPICILAGSSHGYNYQSLNGNLQLNSEEKIGLKVHNEDGMYRYNSVQFSVIKSINKREMMSENLRVLYVAITRAKEQMIIFNSQKDIEKYVNKLSSKIIKGRVDPVIVKNISSDGDIVTLSALLHKDGALLRGMCSAEIDYDSNSNFDFDVDILNFETEVQEENEENVPSDNVLLKEIKNKLSFRYENYDISCFQSKRNASSLDEKEQNFKYLTSSKPAFLNKENMTSAQRGTAMHTFMQFCDYENAKCDLENEINRLMSLNHLSSEQASSLDRKRLSNLFGSDFAKRMFNSDAIYREIKVSSFVPVCQLENTDNDSDVLVQGIADCVFEENDELILVDYKTDKVDNEEELLDRYKNQIGFYKSAVSKTLNKPVKQAVLYSFYLNKVCIYK